MTLNKRIMRKLRTKQTISGVVITLVCLHISCVYSDPAMNWSSRSLAGFRKLFQNSRPEQRTSPAQTSQTRSYQSNSSVAPNRANILSVRNDNNKRTYTQPRNRLSPSTQITKRKSSWSLPNIIGSTSPRESSGHQYKSHSRYDVYFYELNIECSWFFEIVQSAKLTIAIFAF